MWLITRIGFFNIICQDDDKAKELLTIKARSEKDLLRVQDIIDTSDIETSNITDYRFRVKARKTDVVDFIGLLVSTIDYPKTKPELAKLNPGRHDIHLNVWEALYDIQTRDAKKA